MLAKLGEGGFGAVYAATNLVLGTEVAVKVIRGPDGDARALREARAAAQLRSHHSVRVFDVGRAPSGALFIVMELLPGRSLRERLAADGPLKPALAAKWLSQICLALREAHALGLVHRDVKPSNLFVVEGPSLETHVKLLDFGLAKFLEFGHSELTQSGAIVGSPHYMSPEQVRGVEVTTASDVWALGIVLYECLSGARPFDRETPGSTLVAIASEPPRPLAKILPGLPEGIYRIVARCLRKAPAERFGSVDELRAALAALALDDSTPDDVLRASGRVPYPEADRESHTASSEAMYRDERTSSPVSKPAARSASPEGRRRTMLAVVLVAAAVIVLLGFARLGRDSKVEPTPARSVAALPAAPTREAPAVNAVSSSLEYASPSALSPKAPPSAAPSAKVARSPSPAARSRNAVTASVTPPAAPSSAASSRLALEPDF